MVEIPDVVSKEEILSFLDTKWAGKNLVCVESVDSTNNLAKQLAEQGHRREPWWLPTSRPEAKAEEAVPGVHRKEAPLP